MSSRTNPKTVELYGFGPQHEAIANGAIMPGMLVERIGKGVGAHSVAGGISNLCFANEFSMSGNGIETPYAEDDQVIFTTYVPGSGIYGLLAAGQNVEQFDHLSSNGDGSLKVAESGDIVLAVALDATNNAGETDMARIRVETLSPQRESEGEIPPDEGGE